MNNWLSSERSVICDMVSVGFPRGSWLLCFNHTVLIMVRSKYLDLDYFFLLVPRLCEDSFKGIF